MLPRVGLRLSRWAPDRTVYIWFGLLVVLLVAGAAVYFAFGPLADLIAKHDVGTITQHRAAALQTARDAARGRLVGLGAGLFAAGTLVYTARNYALSRQGQVTDRYAKAIEQVASPERNARIGGIYALERIARDSSRDYGTIMDFLTEFIRDYDPREHRPSAKPGAGPPKRTTPPDVQAAANVIGRRDARRIWPQINLEAADLTGVQLIGANLFGAKLQDTNLADANLYEAKLVRAYAPGVKLTRADLTNAFLDHAQLDHADLAGANLVGADLAHVWLFDTDLTGAIFFSEVLNEAFGPADLTRALLDRANLTNANLTGAILTRAGLFQAHLDNAKLTGAKLTRADLTYAHAINADLSGADLTRAILNNADLTGADLTGANLTSAHAINADLTGANLTRADLTGAKLNGAKLNGADLTYAHAINVNLSGADLTRAILNSADLTGSNLTLADLTGAQIINVDLTGADLTYALWPTDAALPTGWQRDTDSGRLERADTNLGGATID